MKKLFFVFLILLSSCSKNLNQPLLNEGLTPIVVIGDSISAGYNMDKNDTWVELLEEKLKSENQLLETQQIINASVPGQTTTDALESYQDYLIKYDPQLVIIQLGGNDALKRKSSQQMYENFQEMIEIAKSQNMEILLLGVDLPPSMKIIPTKNYIEAFTRVSSENNTYMVKNILDDINDKSSLMQEDRIHPNKLAQPHILENVWPKIEEILEEID